MISDPNLDKLIDAFENGYRAGGFHGGEMLSPTPKRSVIREAWLDGFAACRARVRFPALVA